MPNIVVTGKCNLKCSYCFARSTENDSSIQLVDYTKILHFIRKDGTDSVGFIGGEPLIHPDIGQMIDSAFGEGFKRVSVFTNGILLDRIQEKFYEYPHLTALVNVNSSKDIGNEQYRKIRDNIERMISCGLKGHI